MHAGSSPASWLLCSYNNRTLTSKIEGCCGWHANFVMIDHDLVCAQIGRGLSTW